MSLIRICHNTDCFENHNLKHRCLLGTVTLDATGTCENVNHCDEYECNTCRRFSICTKGKKEEFGRPQSKPIGAKFKIPVKTAVQYCDLRSCRHNANYHCTRAKGVDLDGNGSCLRAEFEEPAAAKSTAESTGTKHQDIVVDWIKKIK